MKQHVAALFTVLGLCCVDSPAHGQAIRSGEEVSAPIDAFAAARTAQIVEPAYVGTVYELLDRAKRYPTGREASLTRPTGAADVWFLLSRNGEVRSVGLQRSSGSMLLDTMARTLVRRAAYPAFPGDA